MSFWKNKRDNVLHATFFDVKIKKCVVASFRKTIDNSEGKQMNNEQPGVAKVDIGRVFFEALAVSTGLVR
jgi:hypothetical protein